LQVETSKIIAKNSGGLFFSVQILRRLRQGSGASASLRASFRALAVARKR
jgi:hypothetical protein